MSKHFVTIEKNVSPNAHWQVVARDIGKARARAIAYALCQYVPDALVRVHAGTPDDQCIISMWRNGEFVSYDAWLAMLAMLATPATPATYSVMPDVNDDSGDTMPLDYAGTFAENIASREYACDVARIVSRCIKCHVFVTTDDSATTCEYETIAIYLRGALVTEEQYDVYARDVLFAHERAMHNAHDAGDSVMREDLP